MGGGIGDCEVGQAGTNDSGRAREECAFGEELGGDAGTEAPSARRTAVSP